MSMIFCRHHYCTFSSCTFRVSTQFNVGTLSLKESKQRERLTKGIQIFYPEILIHPAIFIRRSWLLLNKSKLNPTEMKCVCGQSSKFHSIDVVER